MQTNPSQTAELNMQTALGERGLHIAAFDMPGIENYAIDATTHRFVAANSMAQHAHGKSARQFAQMSLMDVLPQMRPSRTRRLLARVRKRGSAGITFRLTQKLNKNSPQLCRINVRYVPSTVPTFFASVQNITRYKEARDAAQDAEALLKTAINALPDGFVLYDREDRLVICNDKYKEIYERSAVAMVEGATFEEILRFGLDNAQYADAIGREDDWLAERLAAHRRADTMVEQPLDDGRTWLRIVERPTKDHGRVGLRIDITTLKKQQAMLERSARTDYLTGLMNRRGLYERLDQLSREINAHERLAVFHIDLDKFKAINDAQGHAAGDFVLRHCGNTLNKMVSSTQAVARVGGDEFIVLLRTDGDDSEILKFGQNLVSRLSQPVTFRDRMCIFGASVGVAVFDEGHIDPIEAALTGADIALNEAKTSGLGACRMFVDAMRNDALRFIQMAQEIRIGIDRGEFEPFFQPQVDVVAGKIIGFEALIRWRHPINGLVPAFKFLVAAERAGLMDELDEIVMDRACKAVAQLIDWGIERPCVSINMSMSQLRDPSIPDRLTQLITQYGISTDHLRIELLESVLLDDRSCVIIENVHRLIALGYCVELDDFGTGHAAIATLRKFDVSRIKIDRSLVQDIDTDKELQVITGAIIALAIRLGIKVLAEGVETPQEQQKLVDLGCSCAQGYLHARPMPLVQIRGWAALHAKSARFLPDTE